MHRRRCEVVRMCLGLQFRSRRQRRRSAGNLKQFNGPPTSGAWRLLRRGNSSARNTLDIRGGARASSRDTGWRPAGTRRCMGESIAFESRVRHEHRRSLERLLFFNGCQNRVLHGIVAAIERYGPPEIVADGEFLRVRVAKQPDVQTLFAIDAASGRPIGVAVYLRADLEHVTVLHLGISEEYCAGGPQAATRLPLRLMRELRRSSRRLKGVRRLHVLYGGPRLRNLA